MSGVVTFRDLVEIDYSKYILIHDEKMSLTLRILLHQRSGSKAFPLHMPINMDATTPHCLTYTAAED